MAAIDGSEEGEVSRGCGKAEQLGHAYFTQEGLDLVEGADAS